LFRFNNQVQHFKIFFREGHYYIWAKPFESFNELVEYYRNNSISRSQQIFLKDMAEDGKLYQAAYDFQAEDDSELSMRKGDVVRVTETNDPNWWTGNESDKRIFFITNKIFIFLFNSSRKREYWQKRNSSLSIFDTCKIIKANVWFFAIVNKLFYRNETFTFLT